MESDIFVLNAITTSDQQVVVDRFSLGRPKTLSIGKRTIEKSADCKTHRGVSHRFFYVRVVFQDQQPTPCKSEQQLQQAIADAAADADKSDFENKTPHKKFVSIRIIHLI